MAKKELIEAIPPEDYKGSVSQWIIALIERGLFIEGKHDWHGDVMIPVDTWWEILEECEK